MTSICRGDSYPNVLVFTVEESTRSRYICLDEYKFSKFKVKDLIRFVGVQWKELFEVR